MPNPKNYPKHAHILKENIAMEHRKVEAARHQKRIQILAAHTCYIAIHSEEPIFLRITAPQAMTLMKYYGDFFEVRSTLREDRRLCAIVFDLNIVAWEDISRHLDDCGLLK